MLLGIISEFLNFVRCSALRWSHKLTLKKLVVSHNDERYNLSSLKNASSFILVSDRDLVLHSSAQFHTKSALPDLTETTETCQNMELTITYRNNEIFCAALF